MSEVPLTPRHAWQPITPRGVAAFAADSVGRLWLVQLIVALMVAAMAVWFVETNWFSPVRAAVQVLPPGAALRNGVLHWTTNTPVRLAENRHLALTVDVKDTNTLGRFADVELALHERSFTVASLLGYVEFPWRRDWTVSLTSTEMIPWWGAWEWTLLAALGGAVVVVLMASWLVLATLYFPFVKAFAFYANRRLGWGASWKLSGAAMLPGAFVVSSGIFSYGWLGMDLIQLALVYVLHFVTGWIYIAASPFFLPKEPIGGAGGPNPFATSVVTEKSKPAESAKPISRPTVTAAPAPSDNPFASPSAAKQSDQPESDNPFAAPR